MAIEIVRDGDGVAFVLEGRRRRLGEKEWSEWIPVTFHLSRGATMHGMVRAYLVSARPDLRLYFSPIHFQPERPAFPISHPARFAGDLADRIGPYHTLGQAEDTMALNGGHLDEAAFLEQSYSVLAERRAMLDAMMREERHVSVIVFDTPDRIQHMFWRYLEPDHPAYDAEGAERFGGAIEQVYRVCDEIVGQALGYCDERTTLLVLSDHGFTSFRRAVHVNRWLYEHQYLHLLPGHLPDDTASFFQSVDWARTRAYALGLNGIYINRKGREGQGLVAPGRETEALKQEIKEQLSLAVDPETGERMIETVYTQQEAWWGDALEGAPDLVIGYRRGYRGSWKNALGGCAGAVGRRQPSEMERRPLCGSIAGAGDIAQQSQDRKGGSLPDGSGPDGVAAAVDPGPPGDGRNTALAVNRPPPGLGLGSGWGGLAQRRRGAEVGIGRGDCRYTGGVFCNCLDQ
ncbi:MAG: alkaline phosphatase family protein [Verrucomicrobiota bacterium]